VFVNRAIAELALLTAASHNGPSTPGAVARHTTLNLGLSPRSDFLTVS